MSTLLFGVLSLFVAVVVHELGHAIACRLVGFRLQQFSAWPILITFPGGGWKLARSFGMSQNSLSFVLATPTGSHRLAQRELVMIAGGPLLSLLVGVAFIQFPGTPLSLTFPETASFIGATGLWSLASGVLSLIPVRSGLYESDGRQILDLMLRPGAFGDAMPSTRFLARRTSCGPESGTRGSIRWP